MDAAGYDRIILETVGTGQSEIEIRSFADTVVVVTTPNQGDDIQALKAGILEIGDIFAVNKADLPDADRTVADLIQMTYILNGITISNEADCPEHDASSAGSVEEQQDEGKSKLRIQPVLKISARNSMGINELVDAIEDHHKYIVENNLLYASHLKSVQRKLTNSLVEFWERDVLKKLKDGQLWDDVCNKVVRAELDPWSATEVLWDGLPPASEKFN